MVVYTETPPDDWVKVVGQQGSVRSSSLAAGNTRHAYEASGNMYILDIHPKPCTCMLACRSRARKECAPTRSLKPAASKAPPKCRRRRPPPAPPHTLHSHCAQGAYKGEGSAKSRRGGEEDNIANARRNYSHHRFLRPPMCVSNRTCMNQFNS